MMSNDDASVAKQVCRACKTRKRSCDKGLPKCGSCLKRNVICDYKYGRLRKSGYLTPSIHSGDGQQLAEDKCDESSEARELCPSTILFLDPGLLQRGQASTVYGLASLPEEIKSLLGSQIEMRESINQYFARIHIWMPIISKQRYCSSTSRTLHVQSLRPEQAALLLCMKLASGFPPKKHSARTALYRSTKLYLADVEGSGQLTLRILQALILIAIYELGHAIYPAAYLSIGACARYAHAIGVGPNPAIGTRKVLTLVEAEEQRRTWWAILILDRFVNIGSPGRRLATAEPSLNDLLPADDELWDQGIVQPDKISTLASPSTKHMTKFALLCQAARLLGQVLQCVQGGLPTNADDEWHQLDKTIQSILLAAVEVDQTDSDHLGFVYSTLVALHAPGLSWGVTTSPHNERSRAARETITMITAIISDKLARLECFDHSRLDFHSPWALFFAYHVCSVLIRERRHSDPPDRVLDYMLDAFHSIDERWHMAGPYLQLLEAQQAMAQ